MMRGFAEDADKYATEECRWVMMLGDYYDFEAVTFASVTDAVRFHMGCIEHRDQYEHGRLVYTLIVSFGECFIDLSFMPRTALTPCQRGE